MDLLTIVGVLLIIVISGIMLMTVTRTIIQTCHEERRKNENQAYQLLDKWLDKFTESMTKMFKELIKTANGETTPEPVDFTTYSSATKRKTKKTPEKIDPEE